MKAPLFFRAPDEGRWRGLMVLLQRWRTISQLAEALNVTDRTIRRDLAALRRLVPIERSGSGNQEASYRFRVTGLEWQDTLRADAKLQNHRLILEEVLSTCDVPSGLRTRIKRLLAKA